MLVTFYFPTTRESLSFANCVNEYSLKGLTCTANILSAIAQEILVWRGGEKHAGSCFYLVVFTYLSTRTGNDDWLVHQRDLETSHWIKEYLSVRTECDYKSAPQSELAQAKQSCRKQFALFFLFSPFFPPFPGAHSTTYMNYAYAVEKEKVHLWWLLL